MRCSAVSVMRFVPWVAAAAFLRAAVVTILSCLCVDVVALLRGLWCVLRAVFEAQKSPRAAGCLMVLAGQAIKPLYLFFVVVAAVAAVVKLAAFVGAPVF